MLGEFRIAASHSIGGLAGRQPNIREFDFDPLGEKYGAFYRFETPRGARWFSEVLVAAIGEYDQGEVRREYLAIESRLRGSTWHFAQRAEIDSQRDWIQELTGRSSQLTALTLSGSLQLKPGTRMTVSYNQFRPYPYRYIDAPPTPEQLLNDYLRQGFRLGLQTRSRGAWFGSASLGVRDSGDAKEPTYSVFGSLGRSGPKRLTVTGDVSFFTGEISEGYLLSARVNRSFRNGHDIGLTLGHSTSTIQFQSLLPGFGSTEFTQSDRANEWLRLDGRFELPGALFASGQLEWLSGDDLDGIRAFLDVGYRF